MSIEKELTAFLKSSIKDSNQQKERNIEVVKYFYGFGDSIWPTLEETGEHFDIGTRERVRQVLNQFFRKHVTLTDIPSLKAFTDLLSSRSYWDRQSLESALAKNNIVGNKFSMKGVFNLIEHFGIDNEYEIYSPDLKRATRNSLNKYSYQFILKKEYLKALKKKFKLSESLPRRCGVANLRYIEEELGEFYFLIKKIIIDYQKSWCLEEYDGFWYLFEDAHNTLVNYSEKVFSVIEDCPSEILAATYRNALSSRTNEYDYPEIDIIKKYLESSIFFKNENGLLTYIGDDYKDLNDIEQDIVDYFKNNAEVEYSEMKQFLSDKDYSKPYIDKSIMYSPFIYVDKNNGRKNYTYNFVGRFKKEHTIRHESRYERYLLRLRKILASGTDYSVEQQARKEQAILREWLFEDKDNSRCAICNKEFSTKSLVTAHKKKREKCNDAERLDPYIVMPLCLMGCDYLYEHKYIHIKDGTVCKGIDIDNGKEENVLVEKLVGNKLDELWRKGSQSYFESPL